MCSCAKVQVVYKRGYSRADPWIRWSGAEAEGVGWGGMGWDGIGMGE